MLHKQSFANFLQNRCSQKFRNIQGKHLRWTLFSVKFQTWRPVTLLKTDSGTDVSSEYCKIFKNSFFYRTPLVARMIHWMWSSENWNLFGSLFWTNISSILSTILDCNLRRAPSTIAGWHTWLKQVKTELKTIQWCSFWQYLS